MTEFGPETSSGHGQHAVDLDVVGAATSAFAPSIAHTHSGFSSLDDAQRFEFERWMSSVQHESLPAVLLKLYNTEQSLRELNHSLHQSLAECESIRKEKGELYAQIVHKDARILDLTDLVDSKDARIMDLQELIKEKLQVADSKTRAFQIIQQQVAQKDSTIAQLSEQIETLTGSPPVLDNVQNVTHDSTPSRRSNHSSTPDPFSDDFFRNTAVPGHALRSVPNPTAAVNDNSSSSELDQPGPTVPPPDGGRLVVRPGSASGSEFEAQLKVEPEKEEDASSMKNRLDSLTGKLDLLSDQVEKDKASPATPRRAVTRKNSYGRSPGRKRGRRKRVMFDLTDVGRQKQIDAVREEVRECQDQLDQLQQENESLLIEIDDLNEQLTHSVPREDYEYMLEQNDSMQRDFDVVRGDLDVIKRDSTTKLLRVKAEQQDRIRKLEKTIAELRDGDAHVSSSGGSDNDRSAASKQHTEEIALLTEQMERLRKDLQSANFRSSELSTQLDASRSDLASERSRCATETHAAQQLGVEKAALQEQLAELNQRVVEETAEKDKSQQKFTKLTASLSRLEKECDELRSQREQFRSEIQETKESTDAGRDDLLVIRKLTESLIREEEDIYQKFREAKSRAADAEDELAATLDDYNQVVDDERESRRRCRELEEDVEDLRRRYNDVCEELRDINHDLKRETSARESAQRRINEYASELERAKLQGDVTLTEHKKVLAHVEELEAGLKKSKRECELERKRLADRTLELDEQKSRQIAMDAEFDDMKSQCFRVERKKEDFAAIVQQQKDKLMQLRTQVTERDNLIIELQDKVAQLEHRVESRTNSSNTSVLSGIEAAIAAVSHNNSLDSSSELKQLRQEIRDNETEIDFLEEEVQRCMEDRDDLRGALDNAMTIIEALEDELGSSNAERNRLLQAKVSSLETTVANLPNNTTNETTHCENTKQLNGHSKSETPTPKGSPIRKILHAKAYETKLRRLEEENAALRDSLAEADRLSTPTLVNGSSNHHGVVDTSAMRMEINELQTIIGNSQELIDDLEQELARAQQDATDCRTVAAEYKAQLARLQSQQGSFKQSLERRLSTDDVIIRKKSVSETSRDYSAVFNAIRLGVQQDCINLRAHLAAMRSDVERAEISSRKDLIGFGEVINSQSKKLSEALAAMQYWNLQASQTHVQNLDTIEMQQHAQQMQATIEQMTVDLSSLRGEKQALVSEKQEIENEMTSLWETNTNLKHSMAQLDQRCQQLEAEKTELEARYVALAERECTGCLKLASEVERIGGENSLLLERSSSLEHALSTDGEAQAAELAQLRATLDNTGRELVLCRREAQLSADKLQDLAEDKTLLENRVNQLQVELERKVSETERLVTDVADLKRQLEDRASNSSPVKENASLSQLQEELGSARSLLQTYEQELKDKQNSMENQGSSASTGDERLLEIADAERTWQTLVHRLSRDVRTLSKQLKSQINCMQEALAAGRVRSPDGCVVAYDEDNVVEEDSDSGDWDAW